MLPGTEIYVGEARVGGIGRRVNGGKGRSGVDGGMIASEGEGSRREGGEGRMR